MKFNDTNVIKYVFFGTGPLAEAAMYSLYHGGLIPDAIITKPDAVMGRGHTLTAPIIKVWAQSKNIKVYQPSTLKKETLESSTEIENIELYKYIQENSIDIAIVASYGKIIPEYILNWPTKGILNIHPSMLPLYRGPSPIESQLVEGLDDIGLSIMKLDVGMDSGPIYIQKNISLKERFGNNSEVGDSYNCETIERLCGREGANMILQILPFIIDNSLVAKDQDHSRATFCKFIEKSQGDITGYIDELLSIEQIKKLSNNDIELSNEILNKWRALSPWPGLYFFIDHDNKKLRVKINKIENKKILEVTPEGKHPMSWGSFINGYIIN